MLKRIRNVYVRRAVAGLLLLACFVCVWFAANRSLCSFRAVQIVDTPMAQEDVIAFDGRLRIGIYNIAHGRGTAGANWRASYQKQECADRLAAIGELLRSEKLDIIVLNEVDFDSIWSHNVNQAQTIARAAGFPFVMEQRNIDTSVPFVSLRFGNAVLSRYPIEDASLIRFPGFKLWETLVAGKKEGGLCTIRLAGDLRVRVMAIHLEHRWEPTRLLAAERIEAAREASELPLILGGDFNSTLKGYPYMQPDKDGRTAVSWLLETSGYKTLPAGPLDPADFTFSSVEPEAVIDWILVPPDWTIISRQVIDTQLSDHRPVIMEVQLGEW